MEEKHKETVAAAVINKLGSASNLSQLVTILFGTTEKPLEPDMSKAKVKGVIKILRESAGQVAEQNEMIMNILNHHCGETPVDEKFRN